MSQSSGNLRPPPKHCVAVRCTMCLHRWILPVAVFVALSQLSFAQTSDWAVVSHLSSAQKVKVETADGKSHVGSIQSVTDDAIRIGKNQLIQKQDVRHVLLMGPNHRGRNALIGLGVAAGIGLASALSCTGKGGLLNPPSKGECAVVLVPFFGAMGAGIGALLPSRGDWQEVYRSK
jgi:hypothetical protein